MNITNLDSATFGVTDLDSCRRFWTDFGLLTVSRPDQELVMRCAGRSPAVLVARIDNGETSAEVQEWRMTAAPCRD